MRCPYCAEDIKDEALVCKHCQRELFVIKPLLEKIRELNEHIAKLEKPEARTETARTAPEIAVNSPHHIKGRHFSFGFTALLSILIGYIVLIVVHYVIIVKLDMRLIYYQFTSIAVPVLFGLLYRPNERMRAGTELLMGVTLAVAATVSELASVAYIDNVSFWPKSKYEWNEVWLHSASITFGFLAGTLLRNFLEVRYLPNAKSSPTVDWTARFIANQFGDGKHSFTLKTIRTMVSSILGLSSAVVSIATGLWEYWLKPPGTPGMPG